MEWDTNWRTIMRRVWVGPFYLATAPSQGWFLQCRRPRHGGWYVELGAGRRVFALGYSGI